MSGSAKGRGPRQDADTVRAAPEPVDRRGGFRNGEGVDRLAAEDALERPKREAALGRHPAGRACRVGVLPGRPPAGLLGLRRRAHAAAPSALSWEATISP